MAFPSIRSQVTDSATSAEATHTVSLPATIVAGDIILVAIRVAVAGAIGWPSAAWNELLDAAPDGSGDQVAYAWKLANGTEGGTTIEVTSGNGKFTSIAIAVRDASWKIPPFLGTVGTGTTPVEPNAGDCNPALGTKDYFWWTHYSMSGEQTGITAYPADYALNQSGIVTSGTGGLPATNCTMASAARQLAAASENVGAWDITGTLIDWAAYTIAFTPADPIQAETRTQPTNFSPRLPASIAILSIGLNLLQSTLAPIDNPNKQTDWPIPVRVPSQLLVDISTRPQEDGNKAFIPIDWRNPDLRKQQPIIFNSKILPLIEPVSAPPLSVNLSNPAPKQVIGLTWNQTRPQYYEDNPTQFSTEWPNPAPARKIALSWINNNLQNTLAPAPEALPFNQYDWPIPLKKGQIDVYVSSRPTSDDKIAFNQTDWPNPLRDHKPVNRSFYTARPTYYPEAPYLGISCPITLGIGAPGDITCFTLVGLEANPISFNQQTQSNPLPRNNFVPTWTQPRPFYYDVEIPIPVGEQFTPDPPVKLRKENVGFTKSRPTYFVEPSGVIPPNRNVWPNPIGKRGIIVDSVTTPGQAPSVGVPNRQRDWPNPLPGKKISAYHIDYYTIDTNLPPINQSTSLPPVRKLHLNSSFNNTPPIQASIPVSPNGKSFYENPLIRIKIAQTWINPSLSVSDTPFGQQITFNPSRASFLHQDWKQDRPFFYEDSIPFRQNDWTNPVLVKRGGIDWINFAQIQETNPFFIVENSNPLIGKRPTETWIINLLQSTLEPAPGAIPFYQTDYPNPLIGKIGKDWIWSTPFYYVDFRGPFSQFDWPIPQVGKKNHVGYILVPKLESSPISNIVLALPPRIIYPTETWIQNALETILSPMPLNAQRDYPNPLIGRRIHVGYTDSKVHLITGDRPFGFTEGIIPAKRIIAPDWIYSSLVNLNEVVGIKPFNQNEWPIILRVKSAKDLITWLGQNPQILPNIKGRVICLLSNLDEYEIESVLEEYDLTSRFEIYEIESDGEECE